MKFRRMFKVCLPTSLVALGLVAGLQACSNDENGSQVAGTGGQSVASGGSSTGGAPAASGGTPAASGGTTVMGSGGAQVGSGGASGGTVSAGGASSYTPPTPTLPTATSYIAGGNFAPTAAYASRMALAGHAQILRDASGKTTVQLHVEGLDPNLMYPAHVHNLPCSVNTAGDHYKIDPTVAMTDPMNELHVPFTTDATGLGRATLTAMHFARPDAQSVVIHDPSSMPANAKMACADLLPEPVATVTSKGTFAPFAGAKMTDSQIAGMATLVRDMTGTTVTLAATGLDTASMYMSHVHAFPCAVNTAGGHYKLDPTIMETMEANELWPSLAAGAAPLKNAQIARPDAESVVIHRSDPAVMPAPKVACADLVRVEAYLPYKTEGTAKLTQAGMTKFPMLTASATMTRTLPTTTEATVTVSGLGKSTMYGIHVHELSCASSGGGSHYKIDPTVTMAMETNEIWLSLTTDGSGAGMKTTSVTTHLARPEAGSIVIHDSDTMGTRLACIDLK
jgi:Cu-Zn family superoxide dismutase